MRVWTNWGSGKNHTEMAHGKKIWWVNTWMIYSRKKGRFYYISSCDIRLVVRTRLVNFMHSPLRFCWEFLLGDHFYLTALRTTDPKLRAICNINIALKDFGLFVPSELVRSGIQYIPYKFLLDNVGGWLFYKLC